ncbi:DUF84 family protein [Terrilactibacillus sp. BCM23-1]|uniref:inosine/xanthosine triphosphatase n=1 Tax=Terrilactibacillus tamarindi TaxID=2599694 RepID=A0A6N8CTW9_9BACI|nr:DUF84 family protein [Terrilactibacillus tamarindi]MTT32533.1 DUF84 family protein [Terrilactibacillus tamarindi]
MLISIGTTNPAKLKAVESLIQFEKLEATCQSIETTSGVRAQPLSDEETRKGAIHRAKSALEISRSDISIGLEGGVTEHHGELYLCNWGALVDRQGHLFTASGAKIVLPTILADGIRQGHELGDLIDEFSKKHNVRKGAGTIGILTNGRLNRSDMFFHVLLLLYGQYCFYHHK